MVGTGFLYCQVAIALAALGTVNARSGARPTSSPTSAPTDACNANIKNPDAKEVYVVFSNHLDVGYDIDGQANFGYSADIINTYMNEYFHLAITTAKMFRENPADVAAGRTYTWMGFPYLFDILLNCKDTTVNIAPGAPSNLKCPNALDLELFVEAMEMGPNGGLTYQAFPHNAEPEMYTAEFFEVALNLTERLSETFSRPKRITYSQRDVPGLTRNTIPLLAKHGIKAISVGENFAPRAIAVLKEDENKKWPTKVFKWIDPNTNTSMLTLLHPHGYGGIHACDCVYVEPAKTSLCTAWNQDNIGPHTYSDALDILNQVQTTHPNAKVITSDGFDDFVRKILPFEDQLPAVEYEIGDSWVFGASADPIKASTYRALIRSRQDCVATGKWNDSSTAEQTFDRLMLKLGEHTWGTSGGDCKTLPLDNPSFRGSAAFPSSPNSTRFFNSTFDPYCINTWYEQRMWILNAVEALKSGNAACYSDMKTTMDAISPTWESGKFKITPHSSDGFIPVAGKMVTTPTGVKLQFNEHGGIISLKSSLSNHTYATPNNPLGQFSYVVVSGNDTRSWIEAYGAIGGAADYANMGTNGLENTTGTTVGATGYHALPAVDSILTKPSASNLSCILVRLSMPERSYVEAGAPQKLSVLYTINETAQGLTVDIDVHLLGKMPTKHKETGFFTFQPKFEADTVLQIDKLGAWIDPTDVIPINGSNMHMHGVTTGARWLNGKSRPALRLVTLDAPVLSVGRANPVPTTAIYGDPLYDKDRLTPNPEGGVHISLFNNIWNTNYPFWYPWQTDDMDIQYRFRIEGLS